MFLANMELALRTEESADDITAAETAPRPKNDTATGVNQRSTSGSIIRVWSSSWGGIGLPYSVSFQSVRSKPAEDI